MKLNSKSINYNVQYVDELVSLDGLEGDTVVVTDEDRGGVFVYREDNVGTNNGGTIFNGWTRQYDGAVNVKWFGAKGLGRLSDDTIAIQNAINATQYEVYFPDVTEYMTTYIDLSLITKEICLNLNGSTITQGLQYARLTSDVTFNRTLGVVVTFNVEDSSFVEVGTQIRSSYGIGDTEGSGGMYVVSKTPTTITAQYGSNHSTYDNAEITVYDGAYIGNFAWSGFFGGNSHKVTIKNGTIKESVGYFYANSTAELYSENIKFVNRGLDGFSGNRPTCLYSFDNCSFEGSLDVGKQTFYMINGSSLKFRDCSFNSSNYDPEIHFDGNLNDWTGNWEGNYSNLYIENCYFNGENTTIRTAGALYSSNNLHCVLFGDYGKPEFMDIEIYNSEFDNYARGLIGTTVFNLTKNILLGKVTIDNIRSNIPFGYMMANNVVINNTLFSVSNSLFFLSPDYTGTVFTQFQINPSNGSSFRALWNNCTFRFQADAGVFTNSSLTSCIFDNCKLKLNDYSGNTINDIIIRGDSSGITISPLYSSEFLGGCDGLVLVDNNSNFPLNFSNMFNGTYDKYAQLFTVQSIKGGAKYDVAVYNTDISLSGEFRIPADSSFTTGDVFKGDDWFVPSNSSFCVGRRMIGVSENGHLLASSTGYSAGTTAITVTGYIGYPFIAVGDYINIVLANGKVFTTTIAGVSGYNLTLTTGLPSALASGGNICTFKFRAVSYA